MATGNPWDQLVHLYDHGGGPEDVPPATADDVVISWPPLLELFTRSFGVLAGKRTLDFGCGTGRFCHKLCGMGAQVLGVDTSPAMIAAARRINRVETELRTGSMDTVAPSERFHAITALMVLPFFDDLPDLIGQWNLRLEPDGVIGITVFNPGFVRDLLKVNQVFRDFDSAEQPHHGLFDPTGKDPLPVVVRYAEEYVYAFEEHGLRLVWEARPPFSAEYLVRYPCSYPTHTPKYLVMGFQRRTA